MDVIYVFLLLGLIITPPCLISIAIEIERIRKTLEKWQKER